MKVKRNWYVCEPLILEWPTDSLVGIETSVTHNRNLQLRKQASTTENKHANNSVKGNTLFIWCWNTSCENRIANRKAGNTSLATFISDSIMSKKVLVKKKLPNDSRLIRKLFIKQCIYSDRKFNSRLGLHVWNGDYATFLNGFQQQSDLISRSSFSFSKPQAIKL